jgi:hypothetical protein
MKKIYGSCIHYHWLGEVGTRNSSTILINYLKLNLPLLSLSLIVNNLLNRWTSIFLVLEISANRVSKITLSYALFKALSQLTS